MALFDNIKKLLNRTRTHNLDAAYVTTMNHNLDLFSKMGAIRGGNRYYPHSTSEADFLAMVDKAMQEDKRLALSNLIYLRDILGGLGERELFRTALREVIIPKYGDKIEAIIEITAQYGRWDDTLELLDNDQTAEAYANIIRQKLEAESPESPTLMAKWLPSINTSNDKQTARAKKLARLMGYSYKEYRQALSRLRNAINIVETNLTQRNYERINYRRVPGRAMKLYQKAFLRNDPERFETYLADLASGKVKAKSDTLYPHEIVKELRVVDYWWDSRETEVTPEAKTLAEAQWKALARQATETNTIVVRDGSGSMIGQPLNVATALAILFSEQLTGPFKDKFITFSSEPELVDLSGYRTLYDKLVKIVQYNDVTNTDIEKVYELILKASLMTKKPADYIDRIVIISDMQFDRATSLTVPSIHRELPADFDSTVDSTFNAASEKFKQAGIPFPEIVFWNVNSYETGFPASKNDHVKLVSGYSNRIIQDIMSNESISAEEYMKEVLGRYAADAAKLME